MFCNILGSAPPQSQEWWKEKYYEHMQIMTAGSSSLDEVSNDVVEAMVKAHTNIGDIDEALSIIEFAPKRMSYSTIAAFELAIFGRKAGSLASKDLPLAFEMLYKALHVRIHSTVTGSTFLRAFQRICSQPCSEENVVMFERFFQLATDANIEGSGATSKNRVLVTAETMKREWQRS